MLDAFGEDADGQLSLTDALLCGEECAVGINLTWCIYTHVPDNIESTGIFLVLED